MTRATIITLLCSVFLLAAMWMPEMCAPLPRTQSAKPRASKVLYCVDMKAGEPEAAKKSTWAEVRETVTWLIGTVNGIMVLVSAIKKKRRRKA